MLDAKELQQVAGLLGDALAPRLREMVAELLTVKLDAVAQGLRSEFKEVVDGEVGKFVAQLSEFTVKLSARVDEVAGLAEQVTVEAKTASDNNLKALEMVSANATKALTEHVLDYGKTASELRGVKERVELFAGRFEKFAAREDLEGLEEKADEIHTSMVRLIQRFNDLPAPLKLLDGSDFTEPMAAAVELLVKQVIQPNINAALEPVTEKLAYTYAHATEVATEAAEAVKTMITGELAAAVKAAEVHAEMVAEMGKTALGDQYKNVVTLVSEAVTKLRSDIDAAGYADDAEVKAALGGLGVQLETVRQVIEQTTADERVSVNRFVASEVQQVLAVVAGNEKTLRDELKVELNLIESNVRDFRTDIFKDTKALADGAKALELHINAVDEKLRQDVPKLACKDVADTAVAAVKAVLPGMVKAEVEECTPGVVLNAELMLNKATEELRLSTTAANEAFQAEVLKEAKTTAAIETAAGVERVLADGRALAISVVKEVLPAELAPLAEKAEIATQTMVAKVAKECTEHLAGELVPILVNDYVASTLKSDLPAALVPFEAAMVGSATTAAEQHTEVRFAALAIKNDEITRATIKAEVNNMVPTLVDSRVEACLPAALEPLSKQLETVVTNAALQQTQVNFEALAHAQGEAVAAQVAAQATQVAGEVAGEAVARAEAAAEATATQAAAKAATDAAQALRADLAEALDPAPHVAAAEKRLVDGLPELAKGAVAEALGDVVPRLEVELTAKVHAEVDRIPRPRDGRDGTDGQHGKDAKVLPPVPYAAGKTYGFGDWVLHDGGVWIAARSTDDEPHCDSPAWDCVVPGVKSLETIQGADPRVVELHYELSNGHTAKHAVRFGLPIARGVYNENNTYEVNDLVTFDGSWWEAQRAGKLGRPTIDPGAWRLTIKHGRDAKAPPPAEPALVRYVGTWEMDKEYKHNEIVEHAGVRWLALRSTRERPPFTTLVSNDTWNKLGS